MTSPIQRSLGESLRVGARWLAVSIGVLAGTGPGCKELPLGHSVPVVGHVDEGAVLSAIAGYRDWHKINTNRFAVKTSVAVKCGPQDPSSSTPHPSKAKGDGNSYLNVFVSDGGLLSVERMASEARTMTFPFGAAFVKERYSSPDQEVPDLLTVMIKRGFEYNSNAGDWEFAVVSGDGTKVLEYGPLAGCGACHAQAKPHDYVISGYH